MIVICVTNPSNSRGLTAMWSNLTTLEEHRKVYRQIQDRTFWHHIRAIGHPGKNADVIEIQFQEILG